MGRPQNNGLVELVDEKPNMDRSSWNCMDFWLTWIEAVGTAWTFGQIHQRAAGGRTPETWSLYHVWERL